MKNEEIYNLWIDFVNDDKYNKYFQSYEEKWNIELNKLKEYIDTNHDVPKQSDVEKYKIKLAKWLSEQKSSYIKNNRLMKQINIKKQWEKFINSDKYKKYLLSDEEIWINKLNEVIKYTDTNNKLPSGSDDNDIIKSLGNWIYRQKSDYIKNDNLIKKQNIKTN